MMEYADNATGRKSAVRRSNQKARLVGESNIDATQATGSLTMASPGSGTGTETEVFNSSIGSTEGAGCSAEHYGVNRVRREIIRRSLGRS